MNDLERGVKVWDPLVRIFHWSLALCVLANYFVLEPGEFYHRYTGYLAVSLVMVRLVWGFIGSRHARFADFWPTPSRIRSHLDDLRAGRPDAHQGHNPLGGLMMLTLLALVLGMGLTGWMLGTDRFYDADWLKEVHESIANFMMLCVALHVTAALVMSHLSGINLVRAMITGVKRRSGKHARQEELDAHSAGGR